MKLSYNKNEWEDIPESVRQLPSKELDFTEHEDRRLHKIEMDRRVWLTTNFLEKYLWSGELRSEYEEEEESEGDEEDEEPQSNLEAFIEND